MGVGGTGGSTVSKRFKAQTKYEIILPDGSEAEVLRVPWFPQDLEDTFCLPCSLKMVLEYFLDVYPNRAVRENTPNLKLDELADLTNTKRYRGFAGRDEDLIRKLNESLSPLTFEIVCCNGIDRLKAQSDEYFPSIILYNATYILTGERGDRHAAVFVGYRNDGKVFLNNSYFGTNHHFNLNEFMPAWEIEEKKAILVTPDTKTIRRKLETFPESGS